jgi:hypothetical protein
VAVLERRIEQFEQRLYHGLLVARAGLPATTLVVLGVVAIERAPLRGALIAWAVLACWTAATTRLAWSRLNLIRRLPPIVWTEIGVLTVALFLGLGTRQWHLLHLFVPLVFTAFFAGERAVRVIALLMAGAMWAGHIVDRTWPGSPLEDPLPALTPTAIAVASALLFVYTRRILDDVTTTISAQRAIAAAVDVVRRGTMQQAARLRIHLDIARRAKRWTAGIGEAARTVVDATLSHPAREHAEEIAACVRQIERTLGEMSEPRGDADPSTGSGLRELLLDAVERTQPLGGIVLIEGEAGDPTPWRDWQERRALRRLLTEAIANARKHGNGEVVARIVNTPRLSIEIANASASRPTTRPGGRGLRDMKTDAGNIGAKLSWRAENGRVTVKLSLPSWPSGSRAPRGISPQRAELRESLERRRASYARAVLIARLLFSLLTLGVVYLDRAKHPTLFPILAATASFFVVWNAGLLARAGVVASRLARHPYVVWADIGLVIVVIVGLGGVAGPWMALSTLALLGAAHYLGPRSPLIVALVLSVANLTGYEAARRLDVNDTILATTEMPIAWLYGSFVYLAGASVAGGIRIAFDWVAEAATAYDETLAAREAVELEAAEVAARAETGRELHASLQQLVRAALLRVDLARRTGADSDLLDGIERRLSALRDQLDETVARLGATSSSAAAR